MLAPYTREVEKTALEPWLQVKLGQKLKQTLAQRRAHLQHIRTSAVN